jgi:oligopeptide/dipeptide ABC transporter ATP-binding protein
MTAPPDVPVLDVEHLSVNYHVRGRAGRGGGDVHAVDDVSFTVGGSEILALVGESGCGKTTIAQAIMRLVEPSAGTVRLGELDLTKLTGRRLRSHRRDFQMIFQDPFESLDPRRSVGDSVLDSLVVHGVGGSATERRAAMLTALESAGLRPAEQIADRFPHQLSGGQRQRVSIAAAMILRPKLVVADEPVSMLDVSLRAGILRLMLDLRDELGVAYLFITHDLSLAWMFADRIAVVYLGRIVEEGTAPDIIADPRHPYTQALVSVIPVPEAGHTSERTVLSGETPNAARVPPGCRFHPRCPLYRELGEPEQCRTADPTLADVPRTTHPHRAACHFIDTPNLRATAPVPADEQRST